MKKLGLLTSWSCAFLLCGAAYGATVCNQTLGGPSCPGGIGALCVNVSWTASTTPGVTYNLYRSLTSGTEGTTPFAIGITGTSFQDTNIPAGATALYYEASAVNSAGVKSAASNEACAQVPVPAQIPQNLQATPNAN
jgi:beta-galactosidase